MPQPTPSDVHVNGPLSNIAVASIQSADAFVADKVFPNVPVQKQSDLYFKYSREYWYRTEAALRAPGTETPGSGYEVSTDSYYANVFGVHKDIDDQLLANYDSPLDPDRDATLFVTQQLLLKRDIDWRDAYFKTGVWATDVTGVSGTPSTNQVKQWNLSGSDPIVDIQTMKNAMAESTGGFIPNTLVISPSVETILLQHPVVLERIKYTERGVIGLDLIAALFGLDRILVARGIQNTANEKATESLSYLFGKSALLAYSAPNAGLMTPSAGYTFTWNGLFGSTGYGMRISRFRMEALKSTRVEGEMAYACKVVATDLGRFISGVVQ